MRNEIGGGIPLGELVLIHNCKFPMFFNSQMRLSNNWTRNA